MNNPDRWEIVRFENKEGSVWYKILASWSGGYLDGDSWKLSSGLENVEVDPEDENYYLMKNYSGSIYRCGKNSSGMNTVAAGVYNTIVDQGKEQKVEVSLIDLEDYTKEVETE